MSTQDIADYIKKNLKKGYTLDSLRYSLISQGYSRISVENAIDLANKQMAKEIPQIKERPEIIYNLIKDVPDYTHRLRIKPGITGWAQVNGRNAISWTQKFEYDIWYVENISFGLDLKILFICQWKHIIKIRV